MQQYFDNLINNNKEHIKNVNELAHYVETKDYEKFRAMFEQVVQFWKK